MNRKAKYCQLDSGHAGRCVFAHSGLVLDRTRDVTNYCNQCVTKDEEIARLRNQVEELRHDVIRHIQIASSELPENKPKRDRAKYMRDYRSRGQPESKPA